MDLSDITMTLLFYANKHLTYKEISLLMKSKHNTVISPNAVGKRLKKLGQKSRKDISFADIQHAVVTVRSLLPSLPPTVGYRQMTDILRQKNLHISRDAVMHILQMLDPEGVEHRRRRRIKRKVYRTFGANHVWHVDGYDKLKPYGFPIHGCIDGFSRKIIWLQVGPTNNDPFVVAYHFVSCVDQLQGCPLILQTDPGTENCVIGALQCLFRHSAQDNFSGINSFRVVKSVFNQRIEAWWSMMRRQQSEWWIAFFRDLEGSGLFCRGNEHHRRCLRYSFMPVLQDDLDDLQDRWNHHYIAHSRQAVCPNGRPAVLYELPEHLGFKNCLFQVDDPNIEFAYTKCAKSTVSGSAVFDRRASDFFDRKEWTAAKNCEEALKQYLTLLESDDLYNTT